MFSSRAVFRTALLVTSVILGVEGTAAAQGFGVKAGPTFSSFSSDDLDFKNRTGLQGGIFLGGNRSGLLGLQVEANFIRKKSESEALGKSIEIDYLQVPVLLRLNFGTKSNNGFDFYGIVGPSMEAKIREKIEGVTFDDGFESFDLGLMFGAGLEVSRFIVEGRYEKGLRTINKSFSDFAEIKKDSFSILFGIRFK